jgi:Mg-chelatase subunit ChlD
MWKLTAGNKSLQKKDATSAVGAPSQTGLDASKSQEQGLTRAGALTGYIYLLVDRSASMRKGDKIKQAQKGSIKFAKNALEQGYYTGLIQFDTSPTVVCEPGKDIRILEKAVSTMTASRSTHMAKAIKLAHALLAGQPGMRVIVIVTDGLPNGEGDPQASLLAAEAARQAGIFIIAIGTDDANSDFLKRLASRFDLGMKIERNQLASAISDSSRMLPPPQNKLTKTGK